MPAKSMNGVALVTGAASGIAEATVKTLLQEGVRRMVIADIQDGALQKLRAELHAQYPDAQIEVCVTDVSDETQVNAMVQQAVDKFGRIDYAVNAAGVAGGGRLGELSTEAYDRVIGINERGVFFCLRAELAQMAKQEPLNPGPRGQRGSIVNLSSIAGYKGLPQGLPYSSAKHAIIGMTKVAAIDYAGTSIRTNSVAPGWISTAMTTQNPGAKMLLEAGTRPEVCPTGRPGLPEEMADVIAFLLSEKASYVNGTTWQADGGLMA